MRKGDFQLCAKFEAWGAVTHQSNESFINYGFRQERLLILTQVVGQAHIVLLRSTNQRENQGTYLNGNKTIRTQFQRRERDEKEKK